MLLLLPAQAFSCLPAAVPDKFLSSQPVITQPSTCTPTDAYTIADAHNIISWEFKFQEQLRCAFWLRLEQVRHAFPFVHIPT